MYLYSSKSAHCLYVKTIDNDHQWCRYIDLFLDNDVDMSCHVYLIIYFFIFISQILASCPYIRTSVILAECVFDTNLYITLGAHIYNSNSIDFIGHYSFNNKENLLRNTLIYNLNNRWMLLLPLLLKCSHQPINLTFTECQYTMRQQKFISKSSSIVEYMTTQLSVINITDLGMQSVLFLQPGLFEKNF